MSKKTFPASLSITEAKKRVDELVQTFYVSSNKLVLIISALCRLI